jgi:hypothetical protein
MSTDTILKKILSNSILKEKYWPEIENVTELNINTIGFQNNIYLKYIHAILIDKNEQVRKNMIANLLN